MMAKRPEARFESLRAVADELSTMLRESSSGATVAPAKNTPRAAHMLTRTVGLISGIAVAAAIALAALFYSRSARGPADQASAANATAAQIAAVSSAGNPAPPNGAIPAATQTVAMDSQSASSMGKGGPEALQKEIVAADDRPALLVAPFDVAAAHDAQCAWSSYFKSEVELTNSIGIPLILIPPGRFVMGSPLNENGRGDEEVQVKVTLTQPFWLGQYEVRQSDWRRMMPGVPWSGRSFVKEGDDYPASFVSWDDARKFCEKLTEQEKQTGQIPIGWRYALPTEAQWEYACRAGTTTAFSFGLAEGSLRSHGWFTRNANAADERYPHRVGRKKPNPFGLCDMHGNMLEWCRDLHAVKLPGGDDPDVLTGDGLNRVARGGSWNSGLLKCRSASRSEHPPTLRNFYLGFRVALIPVAPGAALADISRSASKVAAPQSHASQAPNPLSAPFGPREALEARKAWAQFQHADEEWKNSLGMNLVLIPPGEFEMGSRESPAELLKVFPQGEAPRLAGEQPAHRVRITKPFFLGVFEVTKAQFAKFADATGFKTDAEKFGKGAMGYTGEKGKSFPFERRPTFTWRDWGHAQSDNAPVVNVTWNDATAFCGWLSQQDGKKYRLPTEAEWEYACRAGTTTRFYAGDDPSVLTTIANVDGRNVYRRNDTYLPREGKDFVDPVGQFRPNNFGLYDMIGNAEEWCQDWYAADWYSHSSQSDPAGPFAGERRVIRGGAWFNARFIAAPPAVSVSCPWSACTGRVFGSPASVPIERGFKSLRESPRARRRARDRGAKLGRAPSRRATAAANPWHCKGPIVFRIARFRVPASRWPGSLPSPCIPIR